MKDKILNFLGTVVGALAVGSVIACPVSLIVYIWTLNQVALNLGLSTAIFAFFWLVVAKFSK